MYTKPHNSHNGSIALILKGKTLMRKTYTQLFRNTQTVWCVCMCMLGELWSFHIYKYISVGLVLFGLVWLKIHTAQTIFDVQNLSDQSLDVFVYVHARVVHFLCISHTGTFIIPIRENINWIIELDNGYVMSHSTILAHT